MDVFNSGNYDDISLKYKQHINEAPIDQLKSELEILSRISREDQWWKFFSEVKHKKRLISMKLNWIVESN